MATVTVKQSGGDYSTLASALSSRTADGDIISIEGTWTADDTSVCTVSYAVTVNADADSRCGKTTTASPSNYRLRNTSGHSFTLDDNLTLNNVEIGNQSTGTSDECFRINTTSITLIANASLLYFNSRNAEQDIAYTQSDTATVKFTNCGIWNAYRAVFDAFNCGGHVVEYNSCTGYGIGFSATGGNRSGVYGHNSGSGTDTVAMFNCLWHMQDTSYPVVTSHTGNTTTATIDRCKTNSGDWAEGFDTETITDSDLSVTFTDGTPSAGNVAVVDITGSSPFDLSLQDHANNAAQDSHADSTGAGLTMPSTDILGTSRPQNTNYDLGFYEVSASSGASVTLSGVSATGSAGSFSITGHAALTLSGVQSTPGIGTLAAIGAALVNLSGVSSSGQVGDPSITGNASLTLDGVSSSAQAGNPTITGHSTVTLDGVQTNSGIGSLSVIGHAAFTLDGVSSTGNVGTFSITGGANLSLTGVTATGQIGTLTVTAGGSVSVTLTGVSTTGSIGTLAATGGAAVSLDGVSTTGNPGNLTIAGGASVPLDGVSATGQAGTITAVIGQTIVLSGVSSSGQVGDLTIQGGATLTLTGVSTTASAGTISITTVDGVLHLTGTITITPAVGGTITFNPEVGGTITLDSEVDGNVTIN